MPVPTVAAVSIAQPAIQVGDMFCSLALGLSSCTITVPASAGAADAGSAPSAETTRPTLSPTTAISCRIVRGPPSAC